MQQALQTIKNFFKDTSGKIVILQTPNIPILCWVVFTVLARVLPNGAWQQLAGALSFASLVYWAVLEIIWGDSNFRRVLGLVVLIASIRSRFL